ncbi:kinase-like domain-containing protein [Blakeslea trispora]|nr:kinase-like domain-containing protein [Blakeslea trispora]
MSPITMQTKAKSVCNYKEIWDSNICLALRCEDDKKETSCQVKPCLPKIATSPIFKTKKRKADELEEDKEEGRQPMDYYKFVEKIADGNFSSVYKAQDLLRELCNNEEWESLMTAGEVEDMENYVAIKHIHSRSSPARIADEIACLLHLKNSPGIAPLIAAFREKEGAFLVMPYIKCEEFGNHFDKVGMEDIRSYIKSLFTALKQTHDKKIIHRDIKPDNFLYNFSRKRGYLVDFGLAEVDDDLIETQAMVEPVASSSKRMPGCIINDPILW